MRSDNFRMSSSEAAEQREKERTRQINWDKIVYLSLLALLLLVLGRYVAFDYLYVESEGQVISGNFNVRFASPIKVRNFRKREEDQVERGTPLFKYVLADDEDRPGQPSQQEEDPWADERLSLNEDIALKRIERRKANKLLARRRDELDRIRKGVYLDIYTANELDAVQRKVNELEAEIEALSQEISVYRSKLNALRARSKERKESNARPTTRTYRSPVTGTITDVFKKEQEIVLVSERVMAISMKERNRLFIKTVFSQEDLKYIDEGTVVHIEHSNGEESEGRVRQLFPTYSDQPVKTKQQYEALNRNVIAEVVPRRDEDRAVWERSEKMGVTVYKWKF